MRRRQKLMATVPPVNLSAFSYSKSSSRAYNFLLSRDAN
jgi:hypothetical protein